ncbi:U6 small nuclear RNA (adenine-(43)-N(6))-methyltransferase [Hyphodiscus hymeniophilus]|uniref:U6 small nuclear RNA (Adenine-(43)-N(6))-methyltransferase n=1 Tax=Hyphodiscus hymeniophilus TaxID=353542 RepID=A0A9P6VEE2_9HELO|nr:U6 small nuclear RNA (adenine-(43)-N(6))-methyltransferase [Hyphodiscus hymeniophilus]
MTTSKNPYEEDIDFAQLALQDADFAKVLKANGQLDFSNPESVKELTKALLKKDFELQLELPDDRLCPPVYPAPSPSLLLDTTSQAFSDNFEPERQVLGLDIGTGASCIYPLLGCSQRPKWRFAGTDIDDKSLRFARQNIQINGLKNRIKLYQSKPDGPLLPLDSLGFENIDFSMCNPPFYESQAEMLTSAASKQRPPFTACTGSESEMVTPGGEVAFVSRMIEESIVLQDRVQWYSSMLGKFSSLGTIVEILREKGVSNYAVTEFVQGSKTRRWGLAWSFEDLRPRMDVARGTGTLQKALLPFPSEYVVVLNTPSISTAQQALNSVLSRLPLKWIWKASISTGVGFSEKAVWSRAARRQAVKSEKVETDEDTEMAFGFKIHVEKDTEQAGVQTTVRWLKGQDTVIFESFCGMLKRKMEDVLK